MGRSAESRCFGVAVIGLLAISCLASPAPNPTTTAVARSAAQAVRPDTLAHLLVTENSDVGEARRLVVSDPEEFARQWAEITARLRPAPPLPVVDFRNSRVVVVTDAKRGDVAVVRIAAIDRAGNTLRIRVTAFAPRPCEAVAAFVPRSADVVVIPLEPRVIQFEENVEFIPCGRIGPP